MRQKGNFETVECHQSLRNYYWDPPHENFHPNWAKRVGSFFRKFRVQMHETHRIVALRALSPEISASHHFFGCTLSSESPCNEDFFGRWLSSYRRCLLNGSRCSCTGAGLSGRARRTVRWPGRTKVGATQFLMLSRRYKMKNVLYENWVTWGVVQLWKLIVFLIEAAFSVWWDCDRVFRQCFCPDWDESWNLGVLDKTPNPDSTNPFLPFDLKTVDNISKRKREETENFFFLVSSHIHLTSVIWIRGQCRLTSSSAWRWQWLVYRCRLSRQPREFVGRNFFCFAVVTLSEKIGMKYWLSAPLSAGNRVINDFVISLYFALFIITWVVESLRVASNGWVGVVLMFGVPTGLELPEVEVPGRGRLLPVTGDTVGGVTEDITIVGGFIEFIEDSRVRNFEDSLVDVVIVFCSTIRVDELCWVLFSCLVSTWFFCWASMCSLRMETIVNLSIDKRYFRGWVYLGNCFTNLTAQEPALSVLEALGLWSLR